MINCKSYRSKDGYAWWTETDGQIDTICYCGRLFPAHKVTRAVRQLVEAYKLNHEADEIPCEACEINDICELQKILEKNKKIS